MERKIIYNTLPKVNLPLRTFGMPFWYFFILSALAFVYTVVLTPVGLVLIGIIVFVAKKCSQAKRSGRLHFFEDWISSFFTPKKITDTTSMLNTIIKK